VANQRNTESLAALRESLKGRSSFYLVDYQGLTSEGLGALRKELRNSGARLIVAKNTLINIALKDGGHDFANVLNGPSALVLVGEDPVGPAKAIVEFAKKNDKGIPAPKGGVLDGSSINAKQFTELAKRTAFGIARRVASPRFKPGRCARRETTRTRRHPRCQSSTGLSVTKEW
jgi:large subunit ribosomal protein L10